MSDLDRLAVDLGKAASEVQRKLPAALRFEAHAMRDDWRRRVSGAHMLPGLSAAISYDVSLAGLRGLQAEVGYDQRGQGELGNIVEFGSSRHAPIRPAGDPVLKGGADRLEKYLGVAGQDVL